MEEKYVNVAEEKPKDVTERIKTFEDAVHELGDDNILVKEYNDYNAHNAADENNIDIVAYIKLRIVVAALNEGWRPQFKEVEEKWFPWFNFYSEDRLKGKTNEWKDCLALQLFCLCGDASGDSSYYGYAYTYTLSDWSLANISARLALKSEDLAIYCGKQFATLWAEYNTGKVCKPWREVTED